MNSMKNTATTHDLIDFIFDWFLVRTAEIRKINPVQRCVWDEGIKNLSGSGELFIQAFIQKEKEKNFLI